MHHPCFPRRGKRLPRVPESQDRWRSVFYCRSKAPEAASRLATHLVNGHLHFIQYNADSPSGSAYADALSNIFRWVFLILGGLFAAAALSHGIYATLSVPLAARGAALGALNLYAGEVGAFTGAHEEAVQVFAGQASIALANAQVYWDARELSENLSEAIKTREIISQAVGILMVTSGRNPDDAFQILASASQRENRKVRDIAAEVVNRTVQRGTKGIQPG